LLSKLVHHALTPTAHKIAIIFPVPRLNADAPTADMVANAAPFDATRPRDQSRRKAAGCKEDYCWLVFEQGFTGHPRRGDCTGMKESSAEDTMIDTYSTRRRSATGG